MNPWLRQMKPLLFNVYQRLPLPVSSWAYSAARRWVYPDMRNALFDAAFRSVAATGRNGDYLEFGVYHGTSFIMAHEMAAKHGLEQTRFFAFDSFLGLPETEGEIMMEGNLASSRGMFETMLHQAGVDASRVFTIEGLYSETLGDKLKEDHALKRAAIVHIDCDLYTSTRDALRFVQDIVHAGTILIFDDWYTFRKNPDIENLGERRAFREWVMRDRFRDFIDVTNVSKAFIMYE